MIKKKIALFVNGYCSEIVTQFFDGLWNGLGDKKIDVYCFCAYPASALSDEENYAELNIYNLPHLEDFDVAIIMGNGRDYLGIYDHISQKCIDAGITYISTAEQSKDCFKIVSNNITGANELVNYVLDVLGCKDIAFLAGSADNPDSALRLNIVRDAMKQRGLTLPDDDTRVYYTGWKLSSAMDYADLIYKKDSIPEIIICANDELAMAASNELDALGIRVPEDVMVTGFDNGYYAKIFNPSISTVDQNFREMGAVCAKLSLEIIAGEAEKKEIVVDSRFIARESTREEADEEIRGLRADIGKSEFRRKIIDATLTKKIDTLDRTILLAESLEQVHENIKREYRKQNARDVDGLHIILDGKYVDNVLTGNDDFRCFEYSDEFFVLYSRENGVEYNTCMVPQRQLVPHIDESENNRLFLFSPLMERGRTYGYVVQCDRIDMLNEKTDLLRYEESLSISLGRLLQRIQLKGLNKKLLDLSRTDALTSVKNRNAYEQKEKEYDALIRSGQEFDGFSLAVFDVNNLKCINDSYGHEKGDEYIIESSRLLCQAYRNSPVYRIGGDEFVVILTGENEKLCNEILENLYAKVDELEHMDIQDYEKISFAGGIAKFNADEDSCFADVFNRADALMYEKKLSMKKFNNLD